MARKNPAQKHGISVVNHGIGERFTVGVSGFTDAMSGSWLGVNRS